MSAVVSISTRRPYGVARICRMWGVPRASVYRSRRVIMPSTPRGRPGPQGPIPDAALVEASRGVLLASPFHGEGSRKVWARLRHQGLRTSRERVRRLMRESGLSAAAPTGAVRGPRNHDGTIIPEAPSSEAPKDAPAEADAAPKARTPRTGTKQAKLIEMLRAEGGATIDEIVAATGWQPHTVRGAFAGALKKKLGLEVISEKVEGRGRVYSLPSD